MSKFKVGDWAGLKLAPNMETDTIFAVHILEVIQQTCEAGIEQTSYQAKIWSKRNGRISWTSTMPIREMELGEKLEEVDKHIEMMAK